MTKRKEKYALDPKPLGIGGQAEVFRARVKENNEFVALKRVLARFHDDSVARLKREIQVQSSLRHPNVMPVLDYSTDYIWYTMPLASRTVEDLPTPVDDETLLKIVEDSAHGLYEAHQKGYIHRDVKPSNILLLDQEDNLRWVISDWGLVRRHGQTTVTRTSPGQRFGTAGFGAPELWVDAHSADAQADVYSLGRVVAWCKTGSIPSPNVPLIPDGKWKHFVQKTTATDNNQRVQDMLGLLLLLEEIKQSMVIPEDIPSTKISFEPIKILGVIVEDITEPRNDGTRGSALYAIPFQLSRRPPADWSDIFIRTWKRPPKFTTMHRASIARISGDRIILDGTTMEEVEKYHLDTLKLAVDKANREIVVIMERIQQEEARKARQLQAHKDVVEEIASRLKFG